MKRFLTILLSLVLVFSFSISGAFASSSVDFVKETFINEIDFDKYYPTEKEQVQLLLNEYELRADLIGETLISDLTSTYKTKITAVPTKTSVNAYFGKGGALETSFEQTIDILTKYWNAKPYKDLYMKDCPSKDFWIEFYAEKGVRKNTEFMLYYNDAIKILDSVRTDMEIDAEVKAIKELISKLPSYILLSDKDIVKSIYQRNELLPATCKVTSTDLKDAIGDLETLEKNNLNSLIKKYAILSEEEILEYFSLCDSYLSEEMYDSIIPVGHSNLVKKYESYRDFRLENIKKSIKSLTPSSDEATLLALETEINDFISKYTIVKQTPSGLKIYDAKSKITNYDIFQTYKAVADSVEKFTDDDAKSILDNAILKARSEKVDGKIVVRLVGLDITKLKEFGYGVEYKFYKKTAKTKYKAIAEKVTPKVTVSSGTKGTKYYFKAKVYIYNPVGELIADSSLSDCRAAIRTK